MTIVERTKPFIDLAGPDGNAFALLGAARTICKSNNINPDPIIKQMMAGDYDELVNIFDHEFGEFVDLIR